MGWVEREEGNMIVRISGWICIVAFCWGSAGQAEARRLLVGQWAVHRISEYDLETNQLVRTLVPTGSGGLSTPDGMDFGPDGQLYVSSSDTNAILKFDAEDGTFLGEFATERLNMPGNMHFGPDGLLYVANKGLGEVVRFDPVTGDLIDVFATGGGLQTPVGLLWDDGMLYVSDFNGNSILRYDANTGAFIDVFANVNTPLILNQDPHGDLLVSSHQDSQIWRYDTDDGNLLGAALSGGPVNCPVGHLYSDGELIVASWGNSRLLRYDDEGNFNEIIGVVARSNDLLLRPVPEPQAGALAGLAMFGLWRLRQRRRSTSPR
ncbi:MAG: NHL repeat-containing protein [Planctomycetota bacterium]